jgi:hypothetical protein
MNDWLIRFLWVFVACFTLWAASVKPGHSATLTPTAATPATPGTLWGPSCFVASSFYKIPSNFELDAETDAITGAQYGMYTGSYSIDSSGNLDFSPAYYVTLDLGLDVQDSARYAFAGASLGWTNWGLTAGYRVGRAGDGVLVAINASLSLLKYLKFIDFGAPANLVASSN